MEAEWNGEPSHGTLRREAAPRFTCAVIRSFDYCYLGGEFEAQKSYEMQIIYAITQGN